MNIQQFFDHHGLSSNPFVEEDAQTDLVFKEHCLKEIFHPAWDKIYGNPSEPATSLVFGEKGSGKTAIRLQILEHVNQYNREHAGERVFVIDYVDFNPFLDRFRETLSSRRRKPDRVLSEWKLWDHIDAILSLGITGLADRILGVSHPTGVASEIEKSAIRSLDRNQARDLLLLAACYDQSTAETFKGRWHRLRRKLRFRTFSTYWDIALCVLVTCLVFGMIFWQGWWDTLRTPWPYAIVLVSLLPRVARIWKWFWSARQIAKHVRTGNHRAWPLCKVLLNFSGSELGGQPLPNKDRTDDRFELFCKLQAILQTLGFSGVLVLVDRVDEPHLINGRADFMKAFLWPLLDNKLLKHPGLGFKLLLPIEVEHYLEREDRAFFQRARLDKQNMIPSLEWTGEALYDVASARIRACAKSGSEPALRGWFDSSVSEQRLIEAFRSLRVPRHLFKFLYRLLVEHGSAHTDENPSWQISSELFESVLAVYLRDQDQVDRGLRAG